MKHAMNGRVRIYPLHERKRKLYIEIKIEFHEDIQLLFDKTI